MQTQIYYINDSITLTNQLIKFYVEQFWTDVFTPLTNENPNIHLMLMCKLEYDLLIDNSKIKSLGQMRMVNFCDNNAYFEYLTGRLGILSDSYTVTPFNKLMFTFIIRDGLAPEGSHQLLIEPQYECKAHSYNNAIVPVSMNPEDYGQLDGTCKFDAFTRYFVSHKNVTFYIDVYDGYNKVQLKGPTDLTWVDTVVSEDIFKRDIIKNTIYYKNGEIVHRQKILNAQPMKTLSPDEVLTNNQTIMTIDIETYLNEDRVHKPFLIAGFNNNKLFHRFIENSSQEAENNMINNFITDIIRHKNVKYVYAHNFSGFDGTFILKYLINFNTSEYAINEGLKFITEPLIFDGRLISIKFKIKKGNKTRVIWFKDSYLLLPMSLRILTKAFNVLHLKTYLPFVSNYEDILYEGPIPDISKWHGIPQDEYDKIYSEFNNQNWSYKTFSVAYCYNDCKCLFEVLVKFNNLVFKEFKINVHESLTLPSLAMKIFKTHFMPNNKIFKIVGRVEYDIREAYTGGAVDVFIPHNKANRDFNNPARTKLYYYDANSLYPTIMAKFPVPVGKPIVFEGNILEVDPDAYGFFYCRIESPEFLEHPILQRRIKTSEGTRTIAGLGIWAGWIYSDEYHLAIKMGYKIQIIRGYKFEKGYVFKEYIEKMYNLRLKYSKDTPMNLIAKLLMNSLYGKFGMRSEFNKVDIIQNDRQLLNDYLDEHKFTIQDSYEVGGHLILIRKNVSRFLSGDESYSCYGPDVNVAIAAAITAGGRVYMSFAKNNSNFNLYYSDTDSIVIDKPLNDRKK